MDAKQSKINGLAIAPKEVLNINECSYLTGYSVKYLYKLSCYGRIPCYRPRKGRIYFNRSEVEQWLLRGKKECNGYNNDLK